MRKRWGVVLTAVVLACLGAISPAAAQDEAETEDDDILTTALWVYEVLPEEGRIAVTATFSLTAQKPAESIPGGTRSFFWTGFSLFVDSKAENVVAIQNDTVLETDREVFDKDLDLVGFDFLSNVNFGQTGTVVVTYDIIGAAPGASNTTRVNPAQVIATLYPDPALDELEVQLYGVSDFDTRPAGFGTLQTNDETGETFYGASFLDESGELFGIDLRRVDGFDTASAGGTTTPVTIESWPGDDVWRARVRGHADTTLGTIGELTGLDWPLDGPLTVREVVPRDDEVPNNETAMDGLILLSDSARDIDVVRGLSFVWFNDDLIEEGWIIQGLSQEFTAHALEPDDPQVPGTISTSDAAYPLSEYVPGEGSSARNQYGLGGSWAAMRAITDDIGIDGLGSTVQALDAGEIPYVGASDPEILTAEPSWRTFLDLAEERGGSNRIDDVLREWVVPDDSLRELDRRDATRNGYARLEQGGAGWAPPYELRIAMTEWRFDDADLLITDAETILDDYDTMVELLEPFDLTPPASIRSDYEATDGDLDQVLADAESALASAELVADAHGRADADPSIVDRIGLIGRDVDEPLGRMDDAFTAGDFDQVQTVSQEIDGILDDAGSAGTIRLGGAALLVAVLLGGCGLLVLVRGKRSA